MTAITRDFPLCSSKGSWRKPWNLFLPLTLLLLYSHPLGRSLSWPIHFPYAQALPCSLDGSEGRGLYIKKRVSRSWKVYRSWDTRRFWKRWMQFEGLETPVFYTFSWRLLSFIPVVHWSFLVSLFCQMYPMTTTTYNSYYANRKSRAHCDNSWLFSSSTMKIFSP